LVHLHSLQLSVPHFAYCSHTADTNPLHPIAVAVRTGVDCSNTGIIDDDDDDEVLGLSAVYIYRCTVCFGETYCVLLQG
jgi:hypothetical protein